jgi:predicted ArsR family transcriptional regulator
MGRVEAESRMNVEHVARGVVYMATLPLKANVQFMTVMATKCPISAAAKAQRGACRCNQRLYR